MKWELHEEIQPYIRAYADFLYAHEVTDSRNQILCYVCTEKKSMENEIAGGIAGRPGAVVCFDCIRDLLYEQEYLDREKPPAGERGKPTEG